MDQIKKLEAELDVLQKQHAAFAEQAMALMPSITSKVAELTEAHKAFVASLDKK
jgi:hypothetical protein